MTQRRAADLIETHELAESVAEADIDLRLDDLSGVTSDYLPGNRFLAELNHCIDLMEQAYSRDARLYQRMVGEMVGGSLTPLLEEERAEHRQRLNQQANEARQKVEQVIDRSVREHSIRQTTTVLRRLVDLVTERERNLRDHQQQLAAEIEAQQAAGQQELMTINDVIRRYHWLPAFLLSTNLLLRVSILIGLVALGTVLGSFWNILLMAITSLLSAALGFWLVLMRRMPPPEIIEPSLRAYYRAFGQRIYWEEQLAFWTQVSGRLEEHRQRLDGIVEELRHQHHDLTARWQAFQQRLLSSPRHISYLLNESELQTWYQESAAADNRDLLQAFRHTCLVARSINAVTELLQRIKGHFSTRFQWTAEQRLFDLHGEQAVNILFNDDASIINRVFTLAIRSGKLFNRGQYHCTFFIGMRQPERSNLALVLRQRLKQHNLGVKFVENGDPCKITILGLEGGFTINALREGSELAFHFHEHQHDPLIFPKIRSR